MSKMSDLSLRADEIAWGDIYPKKMTGSEYFNEIRAVIDTKARLAQHIQDLKADATAIGGFDYAKPIVQTSPSNTMENKVMRLVDVVAEYEEVTVRCYERIREAEERLMTLRPEYAQAIRYRYIDRKRLGWIADELGYTERQIKRFIRDGLREFEEKWL